jgi:hypothetical protein
LEKIRKKNAKFAKALKAKGPKKSPVKKVQDDGYGHEITVIEVDDGEEMDDDGNLKSDGEDGDYSDPDAAPKSDSDDPDADPK